MTSAARAYTSKPAFPPRCNGAPSVHGFRTADMNIPCFSSSLPYFSVVHFRGLKAGMKQVRDLPMMEIPEKRAFVPGFSETGSACYRCYTEKRTKNKYIKYHCDLLTCKLPVCPHSPFQTAIRKVNKDRRAVTLDHILTCQHIYVSKRPPRMMLRKGSPPYHSR